MATQPKIGEHLLRAHAIDEFQLRAALAKQDRWGGRLGVTLVQMGFLEETELVRVLAGQLGLPVIHLEGKRIDREVLDLVPVETAETTPCLPLFLKDEPGGSTLYVAMENPCDLASLDELSFRTGMRVRPVLIGPSELAEAIDRFYWQRGLGEGRIAVAGGSASVREASEQQAGAQNGEPGGIAGSPPERSRHVLQAVTQLLIEKGVIGKDELLDRLRALQERGRDKA